MKKFLMSFLALMLGIKVAYAQDRGGASAFERAVRRDARNQQRNASQASNTARANANQGTIPRNGRGRPTANQNQFRQGVRNANQGTFNRGGRR